MEEQLLKKVIYTSLVGNYDALKNPKYIMEGWDYICFSNDVKVNENSIWEVRPIPCDLRDNLRLSRFAKLNPHIVLPDYDISLWMDANLNIENDKFKDRIESLVGSNTLISVPTHPVRDCIYEEADSCIKEGRDSKNLITRQVEFVKQNGFPEKNGLYENNIILRMHKEKEIISLSKKWWDMYLKYSKRDQLSLAYLLWKNNINCEPLFLDGLSARDFSGISYKEHNKTILGRLKKSLLIRVNKYFGIY